MNLSGLSLDQLKKIITGDEGLTPYLTGPQLITLFNRFGFNDEYAGGLPEFLSRNTYALKRMESLNNTENLKVLFETVIHPRHFMLDKEKNIGEAVNFVNEIIKYDGYILQEANGAYQIFSIQDDLDEVAIDAHFEQIQRRIIEQIELARFSIWVAVAWFTDKVLFEKLIAKKNLGLNIQVIIADDEINRNYGPNFESEFETYRFPKQGQYENIMHNKFCVIDLKTVVHGSYNWTNKARFNNETIAVETGRENAEKFAERFIHLKQQISSTT